MRKDLSPFLKSHLYSSLLRLKKARFNAKIFIKTCTNGSSEKFVKILTSGDEKSSAVMVKTIDVPIISFRLF